MAKSRRPRTTPLRPRKSAEPTPIEDHVQTATGRTYTAAEYEQRLLPEFKAERAIFERDSEGFRNNVAAGIDRLKSLFKILEDGLLTLPSDMLAGNATAGDLAVLAQVAREHAETLMDGAYAGEVGP